MRIVVFEKPTLQALLGVLVHALDGVQVKEDGSLEGLNGEEAAGAVLIAHLVGLLETFIGEPLTLRLLSDIWPNLSGAEMNSEGEKGK